MLRIALLGLLTAAVVQVGPETPAATVGKPAPTFSNVATDGKTYSLEALRGKWVVLEWYNPSCSYTRTHYESGNMPRLQRDWTRKGVVWLTVSSTARAERAAAFAHRQLGEATAILLDLDAVTARAYQAKTSPHMFVINPNGLLVYDGALDDSATSDRFDLDPATNWVATALTDGMAGRPIATPSTQPYGCAVNYTDTAK